MRLPGLVLGAAAAATATNAFKLEVCSDSLNELGIKDIALPDFVVAGEEVSVEVTQEPNKYINKGHFRVELDVEGVKVLSTAFELCEVTDCNLAPSKISKTKFKLPVPKDIPGGFSTTLKIIVNDHNGAQLSCMNVHGVGVNKPTNDDSKELRVYAGARHDLSLSYSELDFLFNSWAKEHGMRFEHKEMMDRMRIFAENLEKIALHNRNPDRTFTMGINAFAHLTHEEFAKTHYGFKGGENMGTVNRTFFSLDVDALGLTDLPDEVDWTTKGAVTAVKNQGSCGSCWAFSTTGSLEGAYFLKTGKLVSFSEQELVSCDHEDMGCNGGLMDNAFRFITKAGGLCTEDDYPYISGTGRHESCSRCSKVQGSAPKSVVDVAHEEGSLEEAVAKQPVAVAIEADQLSFQFYRHGVLTGSCGARLDHGVLVVGYGTLDGTKYWKVKNSWGPSFGLNGYILIERGKAVRGGQCGILLSASYPVL